MRLVRNTHIGMARSNCLWLFFAVCAAVAVAMGPPPGPTDRAICPVEGKPINITSSTPSVAFKNGQRLYFASDAAAGAYRESPKSFWLSPTELPLDGPDGVRGLPDMRNQTVRCPSSGESLLVDMPTPRIIHRHGQNLFVCCYGCVHMLWTDPQAFIVE